MASQGPCVNPFDRSLVAYALASGAVASSASGAIVYSGAQNLSLSAGSGSANALGIDVNGGGTDFTLTFLAHNGTNPGRLDIASSASAATLASSGSNKVAAALSLGDSISSSPTPNQWGGTSSSKLMTEFDATTGAALVGAWGNTTKYIGGRIETSPGSGQFYYGWIRISTPSSDAGNVTVHDWAYETTAGQSILAGQISAIPGGGAMALFSLGASGLGRWRRRKRVA